MIYRPDCEFRPVFDFQFAEYFIQIFLNRAFGKMQNEGDLFIELSLPDQLDDLFLTKREVAPERLGFGLLWLAASRTDALLAINPEFVSATAAIPDVFT